MVIRVYLFLLAFMLVSFSLPGQESKSGLQVVIHGLRNGQGQVLVSLYNSPHTFPKSDGMFIQRSADPIRGDSVCMIFEDLTPGTYAVAAMHDENRDDRMNFNLFRYPKEGFCFSNNVKPKLRAPRWIEACFELGEQDKKIVIDMIY